MKIDSYKGRIQYIIKNNMKIFNKKYQDLYFEYFSWIELRCLKSYFKNKSDILV